MDSMRFKTSIILLVCSLLATPRSTLAFDESRLIPLFEKLLDRSGEKSAEALFGGTWKKGTCWFRIRRTWWEHEGYRYDLWFHRDRSEPGHASENEELELADRYHHHGSVPAKNWRQGFEVDEEPDGLLRVQSFGEPAFPLSSGFREDGGRSAKWTIVPSADGNSLEVVIPGIFSTWRGTFMIPPASSSPEDGETQAGP